MTRFPILVGACLLVASVVGFGLFGGEPTAGERPPDAVVDDQRLLEGNDSQRLVEGDNSQRLVANDSPRLEVNDSQRLLVVEDVETGERLLAVPVSEGTEVALNYTHSVEKTPVLDVYEVNGTQLEMVRMEFHSYGAGLPSRADVNVTDDGTFVFDPEGSYEQIYVKPGRIAGHELIVGDRTFDLVALSDARSVNVYVANRSSLETASSPLP